MGQAEGIPREVVGPLLMGWDDSSVWPDGPNKMDAEHASPSSFSKKIASNDKIIPFILWKSYKELLIRFQFDADSCSGLVL